MYAVIECGGKQHRVSEGELLKVEKLDAATGATLTLDQVLLLGAGETVKIGTPYVQGGSVQAEVVSHGRHPKINIVKFRRRKHHRKQMGHRQWFTELKIVSIGGAAAGKASASTSKNEPKAATAGKTAAGDDLTRISGVGPVIVEKLAEQGITSFAQIAAFTPDDIAAMDEKLNFKGRIERDNWIEQAREMMGE